MCGCGYFVVVVLLLFPRLTCVWLWLLCCGSFVVHTGRWQADARVNEVGARYASELTFTCLRTGNTGSEQRGLPRRVSRL